MDRLQFEKSRWQILFFSQFAKNVYQYVLNFTTKSIRTDKVFDGYKENSTKDAEIT